MFFIISWRCVVNVVRDISTMSTTVMIWVLVVCAPTNLSDSDAPRIVDASAWAATGRVIGPIGAWVPCAMALRLFSTRNKAKKIGDCSRIGRQELNGLVPVRL